MAVRAEDNDVFDVVTSILNPAMPITVRFIPSAVCAAGLVVDVLAASGLTGCRMAAATLMPPYPLAAVGYASVSALLTAAQGTANHVYWDNGFHVVPIITRNQAELFPLDQSPSGSERYCRRACLMRLRTRCLTISTGRALTCPQVEQAMLPLICVLSHTSQTMK